MKLSISNIAWLSEHDDIVYSLMNDFDFTGLEIAPSRLFPNNPYSHITEAKDFADSLRTRYGLVICSMQSIWYGMSQRIAGTIHERQELISYTRNAIHFADALDCRNIVFGCPKNRTLSSPSDAAIVEQFLADTSDEARKFGITIALEPNPAIYGTNFINTTAQAIRLIERMNNPSLKLNLDSGTILANGEDISEAFRNIDIINHVHISEPGLGVIEPHELHVTMRQLLQEGGYSGFVSIEMRRPENLSRLFSVMEYVRSLFSL